MSNFKLSSKDINFIRPMWKYFSFLLITPWYDFNKKCLYKPFLMKICGCVYLLVKIFWTIMVVRDNHVQKIYKMMPLSEKCVYLLTQVNLTGFVFWVIIKCCFCDVEKWTMLIRNLQHIDERLDNVGKKKTIGIMKSFYFGFFVKQVCFFLFAIYIVYIWSDVLDYPFTKALFTDPVLDLYYEFLIIILIRSIVKSIKIRYSELNEKFLKIQCSQNLTPELQNLVENFRILGETIEIVNNLFGFHIILILFHSGLQVVCCLNFMFILVRQTEGYLYHHFVIANLSILAFTMISLLMIILPMDSTLQESSKFINSCFKIQQKYLLEDSQKVDDIAKLTNISKGYLREFNLAGFYPINKTIIFSFTGNVATYVIIIFQFNEANYQKNINM